MHFLCNNLEFELNYQQFVWLKLYCYISYLTINLFLPILIVFKQKKSWTAIAQLSEIYSVFYCYARNASRIPAATALPITPATLGPIACIRR